MTSLINDSVSLCLRYWRSWLLVFLLIELVGVLAISALPKTYRSRAEIYFTGDLVPEHLYDTSWQEFDEERIKSLFLKATTHEALTGYMGQFDQSLKMELADQNRSHVSELLQTIKDGAFITFIEEKVGKTAFDVPILVTVGFYIGVDAENPTLAAQAANAIATNILESNIKLQKQNLLEAGLFLAQRKGDLQHQIQLTESKIKNIERREFDEISIQHNEKSNRLRSLTGQLSTIELDLDVTRRLQRRAQLFLAEYVRVEGGAGEIELKRLFEQAKTQLSLLREAYTRDHPDIVKLEENIEALGQELSATGVPLRETIGDGDGNYAAMLGELNNLNSRERQLLIMRTDLTKEIEQASAMLRNSRNEKDIEYRGLLLELSNFENVLSDLKRKEHLSRTALSLLDSGKIGALELEAPAKEPPIFIYPNTFAYYILLTYLSFIFSSFLTLSRHRQLAFINTAADLELYAESYPVWIIPKHRTNESFSGLQVSKNVSGNRPVK